MKQEIINKIDEILEIPKTDFSDNFANENFTFSIWSNYLMNSEEIELLKLLKLFFGKYARAG